MACGHVGAALLRLELGQAERGEVRPQVPAFRAQLRLRKLPRVHKGVVLGVLPAQIPPPFNMGAACPTRPGFRLPHFHAGHNGHTTQTADGEQMKTGDFGWKFSKMSGQSQIPVLIFCVCGVLPTSPFSKRPGCPDKKPTSALRAPVSMVCEPCAAGRTVSGP